MFELPKRLYWKTSGSEVTPYSSSFPIAFSNDDEQSVIYPHCDTLVVRALTAHSGFYRMLIDNGNSINILFESAFIHIQVDHPWVPMVKPLYSFNRDDLIPRGHITLDIEVGEEPTVFHGYMNFLIMNISSA